MFMTLTYFMLFILFTVTFIILLMFSTFFMITFLFSIHTVLTFSIFSFKQKQLNITIITQIINESSLFFSSSINLNLLSLLNLQIKEDDLFHKHLLFFYI